MRLKNLIGGIVIGLGLIGNIAYGAITQGFQGGTGYGTGVLGNASMGRFLQVASTSPFLTYTFGTSTSGSSFTTTTINGVSSTSYTLTSSTYLGITNVGSNFTFTNLGITTNSGNWAGTWQLLNPSDFLSSSTTYVATTTGNWIGTWQTKNYTDFLSSSTLYQTPISFPIPYGSSTHITATVPLSITSGVLSMPTSTASQNGFLLGTDWTIFNSKVSSSTTISAGLGLSGGGDLSANRTLTLNMAGASCSAGQHVSIINATGTTACTADSGSGGGLASSTPFSAGYIPFATTTNSLTNSSLFQSGINIGIGTTTPAYSLVAVSGASYIALSPTSTSGLASTPLFQIKGSHIVATSTPPVVSSCGTNPSIVGTDMAGTITVGSVSAASCTVTFANQWTNPPACIVESNTAILSQTIVITTSTFVVAGTSIVSDVMPYLCLGNEP